MEEILGILLPILMKGGGVRDIIAALSGDMHAAVGMDGLQAVMSKQLANARERYSLNTPAEHVKTNAEAIVDKLGIMPYSGFGQGISSMLTSAYKLAPDVVGSILGTPNAAPLFSMVANGAGAISSASGGGGTNFLNPYSVMSSHERAMNLANRVYKLGTKDDGGYDIDYGHGLNMQEMGLVSQRLLSSRMTYTSPETGRTLDPMDKGDSKEFDKNLKRLGSKFNETASMLAKITGSVKEAINFMDGIAGGNFLGGSEAQASAIATRARKIATSIRVGAAMSGMDPRQMYENMKNSRDAMVSGFGLDPATAKASGFSDMFTDPAAIAVGAMGMWGGAHPGASEEERNRAMLGIGARVTRFVTSSGGRLATAFAAHADKFSDDEKANFEKALREGDPNRYKDLIKDRIGSEEYNTLMNDPAGQLRALNMAKEADGGKYHEELMRYGSAGAQNEVREAGRNKMFKDAMTDISSSIDGKTNDKGFTKKSDEAARRALQKMAVDKGWSEKEVSGKDLSDLRRMLNDTTGVDEAEVDKAERLARIEETKKYLKDNEMSESEETSARGRLVKDIMGDGNRLNSKKKDELVKRLEDGEDMDSVFNEYKAFVNEDRDVDEMKRSVYGGKVSSGEAGRIRKRIEGLERSEGLNYTSDERIAKLENDENLRRTARPTSMALAGIYTSKEFNDLGMDRARLNEYTVGAISALDEMGIEVSGDDLKLQYSKGATRMLSNVFGSKLGGMKDQDLQNFEENVGKRMLEGVEGGKSFKDAFADAISFVGKRGEDGKEEVDPESLSEEDRKIWDMLGESGRDELRRMSENVGDKNSPLSKKIDSRAFFSMVSGALGKEVDDKKKNDVDRIRKYTKGEFGYGDAFKESEISDYVLSDFTDSLSNLGALDDGSGKVDGKKRSRLISDAKKFMEKGGSLKDALNAMLEKAVPEGKRKYTNEAIQGGGSAQKAMEGKAAEESGAEDAILNQGKYLDEQGNVLSELNDVQANSVMNAVPNALKVDGQRYFKDGVKQAKKEIENLQAALKGISTGDAEKAFSTDEASKDEREAAKKKLVESLGANEATKGDVGHYMNLLETLSKKKIGGFEGLQVATDDIVGGVAMGESGSDNDLVDVLKGANMKDSASGKALDSLASLVGPLLKFFADPKQLLSSLTYNVHVM